MAKLTTRLVFEALKKKTFPATVCRGDNGEPYLSCKYAGDDVTVNLVDGAVCIVGHDTLHASELTKLQQLYL